ncbi:MAG: hypothetical protein GF307_13805 [candidate division Zixibacteria bacterium]|nr:hypothetical protein [candidate division Zixibacteria bacterium]
MLFSRLRGLLIITGTGNGGIMTAAIIQARIGSTRLPEKVLRPILGRPMLELMLERLGYCKKLDKIIIATTTAPEDDRIESMCDIWGVDCYRGSIDDVLSRYLNTALKFDVDVIVRLTSDCPLIDPQLVDEVIGLYMNNRDKYDYCSNINPPTYPDGLDVEVLPLEVLKKIDELASEQGDREHVTTYIDKHERDFRIGNVSDGINRSKFRWTVDAYDDLEFVIQVYKALYKPGECFGREEIFELLRNQPELMAINAGHTRNEGHKMTDEEKKNSARQTEKEYN